MTAFTLPPLPRQLSAATVVRWLKQPGDAFESGEALVELEAEESFIQVEAAAAGRLKETRAVPGSTIRVGDTLARVELAGCGERSGRATSSSAEKMVSESSGNSTDASSGGKVTPILMPQAGNTMEEGTVIVWRVKPGDQVSVGDVLCEIETDKATMDFESPDAGRLARIVAQIDEPVAVKGIIALLADRDADADAYLASQGKSVAAPVGNSVASSPNAPVNGSTASRPAAATAVTTTGRVKASPAARRVAAERGVELATVGAGSGPGGRILSTDVSSAKSFAPTAAAPTAGEIRRPLSKMRRAIGLNLQQSKQTVPHFYVRTTIDADPLLAFYREEKTATNCTLNDLVLLAVGRTIREFPAVRSQIVGNDVVEYPHANIGIAVGIDEGLVVPVVTQVDTHSLTTLAAESKRVVEAARKGRLENVGKGHFTISNLGMFGVEEFSAIINPPESGILAVSAAREAVIVENGTMRAGRQMTMTLSADHRLVDGVMAAKFMQRLGEVLEHPAESLS